MLIEREVQFMIRMLSIGDTIKELGIDERIFPSIQDVLTQLLATLVIVFLLAKFLWKPARNYIDARKKYVASFCCSFSCGNW